MKKIVVAADFTNPDSFYQLLDELKDLPVVIKIGQKLLPHVSLAFAIEKIHDFGFESFLDLKLYDIPTQVADAVKSYAKLGVNYLTVHLSGGRKMIRQSVLAAEDSELCLLGVSVVTSFSPFDLAEVGLKQAPTEIVSQLVSIGVEESLQGFVCSGAESRLVRSLCAKKNHKAVICTPGIRLGLDEHDDQSRVMSFEQAVDSESNLLVIGRSIIQKEDKRALVESLLEKI